MISLQNLPQVITAIGGLGTAAFGFVDATKALGGGVNHIGFGAIKQTVTSLTPGNPTNALSQDKIMATLKANWFNGTDLASQKAIAKSLIKLNLNATNAAALAAATGVDPAILSAVARAMSMRALT
jgi:formate-dependent phosphoribosylglycinamide formyltransferase (GAR transformylase)